jgi:selenide,water dikinase
VQFRATGAAYSRDAAADMAPPPRARSDGRRGVQCACPAPLAVNAPDRASLRLTEFSHGGGCGCKIAPALLREIIAKAGASPVPADLLVGIETSDDAAVWRLNERQAIVATTDFFMPIVDDPYDFGAIAATNAISDIYAMGGTPLFALALVGMPIDKLPVSVIRRILEGGEAVCARAGIPVAGGHTIDSVEPIYGLVAIGLVDPANLKRNAGAQAGDALVLGKPIGVGIYGAALKKRRLSAAHYAAMVASATQLNTPGTTLGTMESVHALTDVTGFGLAGHLLEICRASHVGAMLDLARVPLHPGVPELAREGLVTGASERNWSGYGSEVDLGLGTTTAERAILTDPQTSGGLLVACAPDASGEVLALFHSEGFERAAVIGRVVPGMPRVALA